jgi:transposase-like protein
VYWWFRTPVPIRNLVSMPNVVPRDSEQFNAWAVALFLSEKRTYDEVASQLGVSKTGLQRRVLASQKLGTSTPGSRRDTAAVTPDLAKYRELANRVRELEKDFLKKVSTFFAKQAQ